MEPETPDVSVVTVETQIDLAVNSMCTASAFPPSPNHGELWTFAMSILRKGNSMSQRAVSVI